MFHETVAKHLETWTSDHSPVLMIVEERGRGKRYNKKTFSRVHYEDIWIPYEKCQEIVHDEWKAKSNWNCEDPIMQFKKIAKDSLIQLQLWSKEEFRGREKKLKKLLKELKAYRESSNKYVSGVEIKAIEKQIDDLLIDEVYWRQRSRAVWLREGDKNTKFFHSTATSRKRKNRIRGIVDENNQWIEEADEIKKIFCEYFENLFTSINPMQHQMKSALKDMPCKISSEMNAQLDQPYTEADITEVLSQMHPTKAPGPDGLPAAFFQKHWKYVKICKKLFLGFGGETAKIIGQFIGKDRRECVRLRVEVEWDFEICLASIKL